MGMPFECGSNDLLLSKTITARWTNSRRNAQQEQIAMSNRRGSAEGASAQIKPVIKTTSMAAEMQDKAIEIAYDGINLKNTENVSTGGIGKMGVENLDEEGS